MRGETSPVRAKAKPTMRNFTRRAVEEWIWGTA